VLVVVSVMKKMVKFLKGFLFNKFKRSSSVGIRKSVVRIDLIRSLRYL